MTKVLSRLEVPSLDKEAPLQPFEQTQLKYLINQVNAAPERVRAALLEHLSL